MLTAGLGDGIKLDTTFFNIQLSAMEKSQRWKLCALSVLLFLFGLPPASRKPIEEPLWESGLVSIDQVFF